MLMNQIEERAEKTNMAMIEKIFRIEREKKIER